MADRETTLEVRLARGRTELLESIDQPPLARIHDRASARRRRRRAVVTGGGGLALLSVLVAATLVLQPWTTGRTPPPVAEPAPDVVETPPGGPVYTGAGITINGLTEPGVEYVPGTIADVEFVDPDHGYLLAGCPATTPCPATVARTSDGGLTWQRVELPADSAGRTDLELNAFTGGQLLVTGADRGYASADQGRTWRPVDSGEPDDLVPPTGDTLLRAGAGGGRCGLDVEVRRPGQPRAVAPPTRPDLDVCWVAPAATADGAWWTGGTRDGRPAVATTRDRGAHWRTVGLPGAPSLAGSTGTVEVTGLGSQAYAVVLGADRSLRALYHSADGGRSFARVAADGGPDRLAGEAVPLLDGRLLLTGGNGYWYVSADDGVTFTRAEGNLPAVGRLARTPAGYVAYNLFGTNWAAYSADGATWRKLQIN
ncbi:beta propeller repeat protein [Plantactinospora sonchi]|uniref:Photosynthesis system II assembly factor Ycf48/Hcf136-like domain-containing protein n=1 Tax=Plantactinospora sonchi TaxID=1544735 RepID=A0ABU7RSQ6_9ACTN